MSNETDRAYAAGVFDAKGEVKVTTGDAVLRVLIFWCSDCLPVLDKLVKRKTPHGYLLTGVWAYKFLCYIQPYVCAKKECVDYAVEQWNCRKVAKLNYQRSVKQSAKGMPSCS